MARRSTCVTPLGTQITMRVRGLRPGTALRTKCRIISSAASKSLITPSLRGRIAVMEPGVRPMVSLASVPTASAWRAPALTATTDGSLSTMP